MELWMEEMRRNDATRSARQIPVPKHFKELQAVGMGLSWSKNYPLKGPQGSGRSAHTDSQAELPGQPVPGTRAVLGTGRHVTSTSPFINAYKHFCLKFL